MKILYFESIVVGVSNYKKYFYYSLFDMITQVASFNCPNLDIVIDQSEY